MLSMFKCCLLAVLRGGGLALYHVVSSKVCFSIFPCSGETFIEQYNKMQLCVLFCRSVKTEADGVAELLLPLEIQIIFSSIWRGKLKKTPKQKPIQTKETKSQRQKKSSYIQENTKKTSKTQTPTTLKCVCLHAHTFLRFHYKLLHSQIFLPVGIALHFICYFWLCLVRVSTSAVSCRLYSS